MKTIKTLLLVVAITFSSVLSASTTPPNAGPNEIKEVIGELLGSPDFKLTQDVEALVTLTFNKHNEIVILSIDSDSQELSSFIKNRLNYEKVDTIVSGKSSTFVVPIKVQLEQ